VCLLPAFSLTTLRPSLIAGDPIYFLDLSDQSHPTAP
jgi:hypothetical protein